MEYIDVYIFWNERYYNEFRKHPIGHIRFIYVKTYSNQFSYSVDEIITEFKNVFLGNQNIFFVSLWKISIPRNLENTAKSIEQLVYQFNISRDRIIWSLNEVTEVFNKKLPIIPILEKYWLKTIPSYKLENSNFDDFCSFPYVLKADGLTGWCGMYFIEDKSQLLENIYKLHRKGLDELFLSKYVEGIEISFSLFRIWDNFIRLPISFREKTDTKLTHPDEKIKVTWLINGFEAEFEKIEKMMKEKNIYGAFYLEWIINNGVVNYLEWWTRFSGSTSIRLKSMSMYNIFFEILNYIQWLDVSHPKIYSISVQYAKYISDSSAINIELLNEIIFESKVENTGELPYSDKNLTRMRINYTGENEDDIITKTHQIWDIIDDANLSERLNKFFYVLKKINTV